MIQSGLCRSFLAEALDGVHQPGDTYQVALYTEAATLNEFTTAYTAADEVTGPGYTAGGQALTGRTMGRSGRTVWLTWSDPVWDVASMVARGCLIYNASRANRAVATYNFGQDVQSTAAAFTVQFPAADAETALVRIT